MPNRHQPNELKDLKAEAISRRTERLNKSPAERREEEQTWQIENAEAIRSMNVYFEEHGFPFPQFRRY